MFVVWFDDRFRFCAAPLSVAQRTPAVVLFSSLAVAVPFYMQKEGTTSPATPKGTSNQRGRERERDRATEMETVPTTGKRSG